MTAKIELQGDDGFTVLYASEFELRDGLAKIAHHVGWEVDTEHVIAGWGRPDLYLRVADFTIAVEIKTDLSSPSRCRKAIQQAANYRVAMPEVSTVYLVAAHINREVMEPYSTAYPQVAVETATQFLTSLDGLARNLRQRHETALARFRATERELEIQRRALANLAGYVTSPIGVHVLSDDRSDEVARQAVEELLFGSVVTP